MNKLSFLKIDRSLFCENDIKAFKSIFIALLIALYQQTFQDPESSSYITLALWGLFHFFCLRGCILYYRQHSFDEISKYYYLLIIYFIIVGISYFDFFSKQNIALVLHQDLKYTLLFLTGTIFAQSKKNMTYFHFVMRILAILAIIMGIWALTHRSLSFTSDIARPYAGWNQNYYFWWVSGSCLFYWGYYALIIKKEKFLGYGVMLTYLILGLMFLKRSSIVHVGGMLMIYLLISKSNKVKTAFSVLFAIAMCYIVFRLAFADSYNVLWDLLMDRFNAVDNYAEFDRNLERDDYFQSADIKQLIFGNGIGHYHHHYIETMDWDRYFNGLHLGYANIWYKGGFVYCLFYLALYKRIYTKWKKGNLTSFDYVCMGVSASSLLSLFFEGSWTYTIDPFCIAAPIFYAANNHDDENVEYW